MLVKIRDGQIVRGADVQFTDKPDVLELPDEQAQALIDAGHADEYTPEAPAPASADSPAETASKPAGGETSSLAEKLKKKS